MEKRPFRIAIYAMSLAAFKSNQTIVNEFAKLLLQDRRGRGLTRAIRTFSNSELYRGVVFRVQKKNENWGFFVIKGR